MRVYVAGPYTADTDEKVIHNVNEAIDAAIRVYRKGHYPYIPHLTHFIELRSRATGAGLQWEDYIKFDREWLSLCDALLHLGNSKGANLERKWAEELGLTIYLSPDDIPEIDQTERDQDFERELRGDRDD